MNEQQRNTEVTKKGSSTLNTSNEDSSAKKPTPPKVNANSGMNKEKNKDNDWQTTSNTNRFSDGAQAKPYANESFEVGDFEDEIREGRDQTRDQNGRSRSDESDSRRGNRNLY